jgi:hypothetical protein
MKKQDFSLGFALASIPGGLPEKAKKRERTPCEGRAALNRFLSFRRQMASSGTINAASL